MYPQTCTCNHNPTTEMRKRLPSHVRDTSFRSVSDAQTLRPSCDVQFVYPKMRPPILPRQYRQSRFNILPKLPPFDQLTPLDLDHPSIHPSKYPTCRQEGLHPFDNTSQVNLLPSPLALPKMTPLPLRPTRTTSMGSHPPLKRSLTAQTATSSLYSRSIATDEVFSHDNSPFNSTSEATDSDFSGDSTPEQAKSPERPPTPHDLLVQPKLRHAPCRPVSTPSMPPISFWSYAQNMQEEEESPPDLPPKEQNPYFFAAGQPSSIPLGREHKRKETLKPSEVRHPYEKIRKGMGSPLWSGKSDFDRRLAATISERGTDTKMGVQRAKTNGGKVSKSHRPGVAF